MRRLVFGGLAAALLAAGAPAMPVAAQNFSEGYEFLKAVKDRDGDKVTAALDKPGSTLVNARDVSNGQSALYIVTARRDLTWMRFMLSRGADPNTPDDRGVTPLQLATNLGFVDGVQLLLASGAAVDATSSTGETPLIAAVHQRDLAIVRALLAKGADPERADNSGRSARDYAQLASGGTAMIEAMDKALAERKAKAAGTYGPGL